MNNKIIVIILGALFTVVLIVVFKLGMVPISKPSQIETHKLQVTASFYPLYFFASVIGGEKANVKNLTPYGAEPHDFEPTAKDIAGIEKSDILIINGVGLEPWYEKIKDDLQQKNVHIIEATQGIELMEGDPHVWLDPQLAKKQVAKITQSYIAKDPQNSSYYKENEKTLADKLNKLDAWFTQALENCQRRDIITSHIAFAYLAKRYGLNQVAISGFSPDAEPSAQQLAEVVDFTKKNNVKYIFFETLVSRQLADTIASETGAETLVLNPIEGISDFDSKLGVDYFTIMQENLKSLMIALQCKVT